jgi:predicted nucleic acid-binding protein
MGLTVLDAGVIIGHLDEHDVHHVAARQALQDAVDRNDDLVLPASAFAQVLVGPSRSGAKAVAVVHDLVRRVPIEVAPIDADVAAAAAQLRAQHRSLKLPDALVIATAAALGAARLVTTDRRWPAAPAMGLTLAIDEI